MLSKMRAGSFGTMISRYAARGLSTLKACVAAVGELLAGDSLIYGRARSRRIPRPRRVPPVRARQHRRRLQRLAEDRSHRLARGPADHGWACRPGGSGFRLSRGARRPGRAGLGSQRRARPLTGRCRDRITGASQGGSRRLQPDDRHPRRPCRLRTDERHPRGSCRLRTDDRRSRGQGLARPIRDDPSRIQPPDGRSEGDTGSHVREQLPHIRHGHASWGLRRWWLRRGRSGRRCRASGRVDGEQARRRDLRRWRSDRPQRLARRRQAPRLRRWRSDRPQRLARRRPAPRLRRWGSDRPQRLARRRQERLGRPRRWFGRGGSCLRCLRCPWSRRPCRRPSAGRSCRRGRPGGRPTWCRRCRCRCRRRRRARPAPVRPTVESVAFLGLRDSRGAVSVPA
jgi:hypothetical protein